SQIDCNLALVTFGPPFRVIGRPMRDKIDLVLLFVALGLEDFGKDVVTIREAHPSFPASIHEVALVKVPVLNLGDRLGRLKSKKITEHSLLVPPGDRLCGF
ncbi:MAG: hypothetical protein KIT22_16350, partial [Verrucomicrobiae bacterium]|nr:hypothetical protein [Verrucomicrobiae bacterium]